MEKRNEMIRITIDIFEDDSRTSNGCCASNRSGNSCGIEPDGAIEDRRCRGYYSEELEGFCEPDFEV